MTTPKPLTIDDWLRIVRDAGADDDNNGAEDWTYSDKKIDKAKSAINKIVMDIIGTNIPFLEPQFGISGQKKDMYNKGQLHMMNRLLAKQRDRARQYGLEVK